MGKVDKKLAAAKCSNDPVNCFTQSPDVESVKVIHDEVEVTYRRTGNAGKIILPSCMYGREG